MTNKEKTAGGRRAQMLSGPIGITLLRFASPTLLGAIIQSFVGIVEGIAIGGLGIEALAGSALIYPLVILTQMFSSGAIGGTTSGAMARAIGANDPKQMSQVIHATLVIAISNAILMGSILLFIGPSLFSLLGGNGTVLEQALAYGDIFFVGMISMWLFNMIAGLFRGSGQMFIPLLALGTVSVLHALICFPLVEEYGIRGAAMALVFAYSIGSILLITRLFRSSSGIKPDRHHGLPINFLLTLYKKGLMAASNPVLTISTSLLITSFASQLGLHVLAGYGIVVRLELVVMPITFGIGASLIAMVGANLGADNRNRAISIAWTGSFIAAGIAASIGIFVGIYPDVWLPLFSPNDDVAEMARLGLTIIAPCYGFMGLGLGLYFSSHGMGTIEWAVAGAVLRLIVIILGTLTLMMTDMFVPASLFAVVALAITIYGVMVALALHLGPWQRKTL